MNKRLYVRLARLALRGQRVALRKSLRIFPVLPARVSLYGQPIELLKTSAISPAYPMFVGYWVDGILDKSIKPVQLRIVVSECQTDLEYNT
jgi:hypothetical protein